MQPAILHVMILSVTGTLASMQVQLAEPPAEEDLWVEQSAVNVGVGTLHVEQAKGGRIRLRVEPPNAPIRVRARRLARPEGPQDPPPQ